MLESFKVEQFSPYVGDKFQVFNEGTPALELTLSSAAELGTESAREWSRSSGRAPFTLGFLGPLEYYLPQGIYRFEHPQMAPFEIFLVPIGPDQRGMQYEAIFT